MKFETLKFHFSQQMNAQAVDLYIYSDVAEDARGFFETSQGFFRGKLEEYKDAKFINLYINSNGGSVAQGYGIYSMLKRHPAQKTVYVDGFANSIASIIAMAGDRIIMRPNSAMGVHNMMDYCLGNAAEHRACADALDALMEGNRQIYLDRSGGKITPEKLAQLLDAETMLTANQCLEYGLCDEIITAAPTKQPQEPAQEPDQVLEKNLLQLFKGLHF